MPTRNRLRGMITYLAGPMDRVADAGVGWRREISPWLHARGVIVLDPSCKPTEERVGEECDREQRNQWVKDEDWGSLTRFMKKVRGLDLRMVNNSHFIIVHVNPDVHMCGTYEELAVATAEKKPILAWVEGGKKRAPWWLFAQIPHQDMFGSLDELKAHLKYIDTAPRINRRKRWYFYRFDALYDPKVLKLPEGV